MSRAEMWCRIQMRFSAAYPGREALSPEQVALLEKRLSHHSIPAIEAAADFLIESERHPPSINAWIEALEGREERVPMVQTDVWGRRVLRPDGSPVLSGWRTVRSEPAASAALRRAQGLPAAAQAKSLAYQPPNLNRPEHDGEPRPVLPKSLLDRAVPARGHETWRPDEGCRVCGYRRNKPGATTCESCHRPLSVPDHPKKESRQGGIP